MEEKYKVVSEVTFMNLTYANASAQDIEPIYAFNKELIDKYENIQNIEYDKVLKWVHKKIENNINEYQCIFNNGQKVGYYRFYQNDGMMEIDDLYIFPQFQNQKIGTNVIKKCCAESKLPIFLYVFIRNVGAVSLYEKLGFRIVKTINDSRYVMQK